MTEEELAAIEARADDGCEGHAWTGDEKLYCPCTEQTAVDVRVLLCEVRRLRAQMREGWTEEDLAEVEARHYSTPPGTGDICVGCTEDEYPCDAAHLAAEVRRLKDLTGEG